MRGGWWAIVAAAIGVACNFGSAGGNEVPGSQIGDDDTGSAIDTGDVADDDDAGTATTASSAGSGAASSDTDASATSDATSASTIEPTGDGAVLQLSDAPSYDFGTVSLFESVEHELTISNVGDATATTITASSLPVPFSYAGTGTCMGILEPGESCTVVVVFSPSLPGLLGASLSVEWAGGTGSPVGLDLHGAGAGTSAELLQNPGGEMGGDPPLSWTEISGDDWHTYDGDFTDPPSTGFPPHQGAQSIFAGEGPQNAFSLTQNVDVSAYAETIDASALHVLASVWIRTLDVGNNPGRVRLQFVDGAGGIVGATEQSMSYSGMAWQQRSVDVPVPSGTRSIVFELRCTKSTGETQCDAYFDDASLTVRYP